MDQGSGNADQLDSVPVRDTHGFLQAVTCLHLLQHVVRAAGALDAMLLLNQPSDVSVSQRIQEEAVDGRIQILRLTPTLDRVTENPRPCHSDVALPAVELIEVEHREQRLHGKRTAIVGAR